MGCDAMRSCRSIIIMNAIVYERFKGPISLQQLADPTPKSHSVVIEVKASGLCRSDWHGWMGHDATIKLPHVPGHELSGNIAAIGNNVRSFKVGDRVTLPFVCGCGICADCHAGNHQVCAYQFQPGFTDWGSFAEYVAIDFAETNLVLLPESVDHVTAACLGCRFATAFRAMVDQGKVKGGQWVAVHGCGGVGLSAIMIANALGANVIAIDINEEVLTFAKSIGATVTVNANKNPDVAEAVRSASSGGVNVSLDALGSADILINSIASLRKRGRHIQVGLMPPENVMSLVPMDKVIANELEIFGSHGMQAYRYEEMLAMITSGKLAPYKLVSNTIALEQVTKELPKMGSFNSFGISVINQFN